MVRTDSESCATFTFMMQVVADRAQGSYKKQGCDDEIER